MMEGITIVDLGILIVIFLSGTLAYFRGFFREVLSITSWILAAILAFNFAPNFDPILKSTPVVGDFFRKSCDISLITSFVLLFTISLTIFVLLIPLFSSFTKKTYLKSIDRVFGFLFGIIRGALIIVILFVSYHQFKSPSQNIDLIERSISQKFLNLYKDQIDGFVPKGIMESTFVRYEELTFACKSYN
ncbi:MAG: colicin V production CvpA [Rhodobacteraceae bacterium]|nr:colicin V production CvpA [Paracoccaceae bacterium]